MALLLVYWYLLLYKFCTYNTKVLLLEVQCVDIDNNTVYVDMGDNTVYVDMGGNVWACKQRDLDHVVDEVMAVLLV